MLHPRGIPNDIIGYIFSELDTQTQILLRQTCKYLRTFDISKIDKNSNDKVDNNILVRCPSIIELIINENNKITDEGIKHLSLL